jgi:hypothetical protein
MLPLFLFYSNNTVSSTEYRQQISGCQKLKVYSPNKPGIKEKRKERKRKEESSH